MFPGIDRDVAVAGALLHDIGKLEAYELDAGGISMSDHGRLHGEIPLGYYRVRRTIERLDGFPPELAQAVLHIILSHHGALEHGSPVIPCTREATLVHMIDNLGGRLGSFDRLERQLARRRAVVGMGQGARWRRVLRAPARTPSARRRRAVSRPFTPRDALPRLGCERRGALQRPPGVAPPSRLQLEWAWPRTPKS